MNSKKWSKDGPLPFLVKNEFYNKNNEQYIYNILLKNYYNY
jgi:hypothetical protein